MPLIDGKQVCEPAAGCPVPPQVPSTVDEHIIDVHVWSQTRFRDFLGIGDTLVYVPAIRAFAKAHPDYTVRLVTLGRNKCWGRWGFPNVVDEEELTVFGGKIQLYPANDVSNSISLACQETATSRTAFIANRLGVVPEWEVPSISASVKHVSGVKLRNVGWTNNQRIVVIAPYTKSRVRTWPVENWLALQDRLSKENIFVLSVAESESAGQFKHVLSSEMPHVLQAILARVCCVVGGDSGFMHFAGLCNVRGLALCGPTNGAVPFGFYKMVTPITGEIHCKHCWFLKHRQYNKEECRKGCKSLAAISVDMVFNEVMQLCS